MAKISNIDLMTLEKIFDMGSGYVLDFSNRSFSEFFANEMGVDIDDEQFFERGSSKANRLRQFLFLADPSSAAKAVRKLWEYREAVRENNGLPDAVLNAAERVAQIAAKIEDDPQKARTDAIELFARDETLEELVSSIERDINANKPQVALDRLHTYCMKKFSHLLSERGDAIEKGETLNGRAGRYFNPLRRSGSLTAISDRILRSTVEIFELFNSTRNNHSLAHDNVLVSQAEARFIFDAVVNLLRFVKAIEGAKFEAR